MAAETVSASRRHGRTDSTGTTVPYRPQPSSPTLTNPDMILPDYDEPDLGGSHTLSPVMAWNGSAEDFHISDVLQSGGIELNTPIIYGNGTMLSDIGEVTEVESNVGGPIGRMASQRSIGSRLSDGTLGTSPPLGTTPTFIRRQEKAVRPVSTDSLGVDKHHAFPDFDDTVSIDDTNFQGDDEESIADSFMDDPSASNLSLNVIPQSVDQITENRYSTTFISRRAEKILANAKRRLTTMEDNLTRARTLSYSSVSEEALQSPQNGRQSTVRPPTSGLKSPSHSRNVSQDSINGTPRAISMPQRSASALGAAGGYRQLPTSRSDNLIVVNATDRLQNGLSQHALDTPLEPLSEDDATSTTSSVRHSYGSLAPVDPSTIVRSASVAQVRDLQDQMKGLKGKIHSLREQAAADSMKRRSLQSLRTPSPFTHARWDPEFTEPKPSPAPTPEPIGPTLGSPFRPEFEPMDRPQSQQSTSDIDASPPSNGKEPSVYRHSPVQNLHQAYIEDGQPGNEGVRQARRRSIDNASVSESGESIYEEALSTPVSHEDREDAFDYQNFFLHSAMGTMSRQGYNEEDGSVASDDSTETTRAPPIRLERRASADTLTSTDSFATATEGRESRSSELEDEEDQENTVILNPDTLPEIDQALARNSAVYDMAAANSSAEDSSSSRDSHRRTLSYKRIAMVTPVSRHGLHRPSTSSFESTGTNRSFPLVNKSRLSGSAGSGSPLRDSPDGPYKVSKESSLRNSAHEDELLNGGASPTVVPLSTEDQYSVDRLVSCFNKCVEGLTDFKQTTAMRDTYRRRLEAARRILEGEDALY